LIVAGGREGFELAAFKQILPSDVFSKLFSSTNENEYKSNFAIKKEKNELPGYRKKCFFRRFTCQLTDFV
jgi:hypothetical protein